MSDSWIEKEAEEMEMKIKALEALLIEACEIISIARHGNVPNMEREVIYGKYLEREEIKKLLEGVKSEFN